MVLMLRTGVSTTSDEPMITIMVAIQKYIFKPPKVDNVIVDFAETPKKLYLQPLKICFLVLQQNISFKTV